MKLSEIKGEQALDVLADLIDPVSEIVADKEIYSAVKAKVPSLKVAKLAIKAHKKAVISILAILDGADPEQYQPNIFELPKKLMEIINDPMVEELFTSQSQPITGASSGSAMEITEDKT